MLIFVFSVLNWWANTKVPKVTRELWHAAYMWAYASVLHLTICWITWSLWRGTRGLTKLGLQFVSSLVKHGMYISEQVWAPIMGYS